MTNRSIRFFDTQFERQVRAQEFSLNPFEQLALPYLSGEVLDLGCGLGNLALAAARKGCAVHALDASPHAISRVAAAAREEGLAIEAGQAELGGYCISRDYDAIACIGLLMFFPRDRAEAQLAQIVARVRPGGHAVVNVLTEGTTFLDMFEPGHYTLFSGDELRRAFAGWELRECRDDVFDAPGGTVKEFVTLVARRPG